MTRDNEDIPLSQIYDFVTPVELRRFENQDYADDYERERIRLLTLKPRGRPKKKKIALPPGISTSKQIQFQSASGNGYTAFRAATADGGEVRSKRGRPKGWRKHPVSAPNGPVPSFNGPQPTGQAESTPMESTTREQSADEAETPLDIQARTGIYSMVAASGLVPVGGESEVETSRDITPLPAPYEFHDHGDGDDDDDDDDDDGPSSKRRRMNDSTMRVPSHFFDGSNSVTSISTPPPPNKPAHPFLSATRTEIEDSDAERQALIQQFKADGEAKSDQGRQSSVSSNDSLLSTIVYKPQSQFSRQGSIPQSDQVTPVKKSPRRRTSLTPHFPGNGSKIPKLNGKDKHALSAGSNSPITVRKINSSLDALLSPERPLPRRSRESSPVRSTTSRPSTTTSTASLGTKQKDTYNDIRTYFSPVAKPARSSPKRQVTLATTPSIFSKFRESPNRQQPQPTAPAEQEYSIRSTNDRSENVSAEIPSSLNAENSRASVESASSSSSSETDDVPSLIPVTQPPTTTAPRRRRSSIADSIDPRLRGKTDDDDDFRNESEDDEDDEDEAVEKTESLLNTSMRYRMRPKETNDDSNDSFDSLPQTSIAFRST